MFGMKRSRRGLTNFIVIAVITLVLILILILLFYNQLGGAGRTAQEIINTSNAESLIS